MTTRGLGDVFDARALDKVFTNAIDGPLLTDSTLQVTWALGKAAPAVAEVRPKVRLLAEPVAPKILTPVLKVFIPKKACEEVFTTPLAVAEASGKLQVAVLPTVEIEKSVPLLEVL